MQGKPVIALTLLFGLLLVGARARNVPPPPQPHYRTVVYWGQNSAYAKQNSVNEKPLSAVCAQPSPYSTVIIGFVNIFFDQRNKGSLPSLNLANHCSTMFEGYVSLLHCPNITHQIKQCQSNGKKVMISLGGAAGSYGFTNDQEAEAFALTIWNMYLGGTDKGVPRPFDDAILDGIDLDIEGGAKTGYPAFVKTLRDLMDNSDNQYVISAAPQCPYPDAYLGPGDNTALGEFTDSFNFLNVQFYNNYCKYDSSTPSTFTKSFNSWASLSKTNPELMIYVGLFANPNGNGYVGPSDLHNMLQLVSNSTAFGGVMIWDVAWSQNNMVSAKTGTVEYGQLVHQVLMNL